MESNAGIIVKKVQNPQNRTYICIDLKSFYASVECVERGLDPMTTNLVVADPERGNGTICLAVSGKVNQFFHQFGKHFFQTTVTSFSLHR